MILLYRLSDILGSTITPIILFISSIIISYKIRARKTLSAKNILLSIKNNDSGSFVSSLKALSLALAGTLGVGNITGVAAALISGGPGSIFWMWAGAIVVIPIKYFEVYLAILFRQRKDKRYFGGAMYYIRDGLTKKIGMKFASITSTIFAIFCCANSVITGNLVQSNSAASVVAYDNRVMCGVFLGVTVLISIIYGTHKIERITSALIPVLTSFYIAVSVYIIICNLGLIPGIVKDIFASAFSFRSAAGAITGFTVREAVRLGIMRGIFSNEAGCGTSPTAHASANTNCPHTQGCFGVIEVVFDTIVLCTLTAFVILIADNRYGVIPWMENVDSAGVSLSAFRNLTSCAIHEILKISVILFAYATIIAQIYYGVVSINFVTKKKWPQYIYYAISVVSPIIGSIISVPIMWSFADIIIGIMTVTNCICLVFLRDKYINENHPK